MDIVKKQMMSQKQVKKIKRVMRKRENLRPYKKEMKVTIRKD